MILSEFKEEFWSTMYLIKRNCKTVFEPLVQSEGLTVIQATLIYGIKDGEISNISSLTKELGLNQGNISALCKNMEKEGLINRIRSNEDERVVTVKLTQKSEDIIDRVNKKIDCSLDLLNDFPPEKIEDIIKGMQEFNNLLNLLSNKRG